MKITLSRLKNLLKNTIKTNKIALIGTEYHSKKVMQILELNNISSDYVENVVTLKSYMNLLFNYKIIFVTYVPVSMKFMIFLTLAKLTRTKVFLEWIGTDVENLGKRKSGLVGKLFDLFAINLCECSWLKYELETYNVRAIVGPFITFSSLFEKSGVGEIEKNEVSDPNQVQLVTYAREGREDIYSLIEICEVVNDMSNITLNVLGHRGEGFENMKNVIFHGWVGAGDVRAIYNRSDVFIRMTKHDGLSYSVLEALSYGLQVIFSYRYPCTHLATNKEELKVHIDRLLREKTDGVCLYNYNGIGHIRDTYVVGQVAENNIVNLFR